MLAVLAGFLAARTARSRLVTIALSLAVLGAGQAARYGVMELVHRPRPPQENWATRASGWAFPSGHSTTAALAAGLLIAALFLRPQRGAMPLRLGVACWGVLVGLTRVYLGVHWLTDVIGGWLFAIGWLGLCLWVMSRWLPASLVPDTIRPTGAPTEDHATEDPGR
jgi:undecaprenyl-diphosphatase